MDSIKIDDYVKNSLVLFGKEVNTNRQLAMVQDGLKVVYRRLIYSSIGFNKMTKTAKLSAECMGRLHPHSSDALDSAVNSLVRWGIFDGQGSHGMKMIIGDDIPAAASRYSEAMVSPKWKSIILPLLPYVPYKEGELDEQEPCYIPSPLPLSLLFSGIGIGFGINERYPMFTANSIYKAFVENDPFKLEAGNGLKIIYEDSELEELWNTGLGRICYSFDVTKKWIESGDGVMVSGLPSIFKPMIEYEFQDELASGRVYILDHTSNDIPEVFVGRSPNVRAVTQDDIYDRLVGVCRQTRMFRLSVSDGDQAYCIPLREWIKFTLDNYHQLLETYKADKISKLWFDYDVFDWLPCVAEQFIKDRTQTAEDLSKATGCKLEVVEAILKKSIKTLSMSDSTDKLKAIKAKIKEYEAIEPVKYTEDLISKL